VGEHAQILALARCRSALVALLYAHFQITEARRAEREANANELWRETLRLGFDNPKLSDPSLKLADFDYDKLTIDGSRELFQKYEIYVDTVLNASDEILEISPTEDWKTSLRIQLWPHREYLLSPHFKQSGYLDEYGKNLRSFFARNSERTLVESAHISLPLVDAPPLPPYSTQILNLLFASSDMRATRSRDQLSQPRVEAPAGG
jgi:hypothetical protein